jgi:hypothetical protein
MTASGEPGDFSPLPTQIGQASSATAGLQLGEGKRMKTRIIARGPSVSIAAAQ